MTAAQSNPETKALSDNMCRTSLLDEVVRAVGTSVQKSLSSSTAASEAYVSELQKRISALDEEIRDQSLSAEQINQKHISREAYIRELKEEAVGVREANVKTVMYVAGFGSASVVAIALGLNALKATA